MLRYEKWEGYEFSAAPELNEIGIYSGYLENVYKDTNGKTNYIVTIRNISGNDIDTYLFNSKDFKNLFYDSTVLPE